MVSIVATGNYYATVGSSADGVELSDLQPALDEVSSERFRRIDRFVQLALIGSGRCVGNSQLAEKTGVYIGSGLGSIANTIKVQQQVIRDRRLPRPADFINTLSNTAGYYVARNLDLQGQNLFVSRGEASMDAAFQLALMDLSTGMVETALVGVVDECAMPLSDHARRMKLDTHTVLAEGSHWFLIQSKPANKPLCRITDSFMLHDADELHRWLHQRIGSRITHVYRSPRAEQALAGGRLSENLFNPDLGHYPSRTAGALIAFIKSDYEGELLTVTGDESGRYHLTLTTKN
jgi:hypothetical protein